MTFETRNPVDQRGQKCARSTNLSPVSCDLDLWPPNPKVDYSMPLPCRPLVPICIKISSLFSKYFQKFGND